MGCKKPALFFSSCLFCWGTLTAQVRITELNRQLYYTHSALPAAQPVKPVLAQNWQPFHPLGPKKDGSKISNALFRDDLLKYDREGTVNFSVNPLFNFEAATDRNNSPDSLLYTNTRGFKVEGNLGRFTFYSSFFENQSRYPGYVSSYVRETRASIGMGRVKTFKVNAFDYAMSTGLIVFRPAERSSIWFGHGKNVVGNGYRSLLLSDHAASYPFLKADIALHEKWRYVIILASLLSSERYGNYSTIEPSLYRKGATFSYLSFRPSDHFEIGLFEGITWKRVQGGKSLPLNPLQLNPVIMVGTATQGLEGKNNALLGLNLSWQPLEKTVIYGQAMLDGSDQRGFQLGAFKKDLLVSNFYAQVEFNLVSPNTYIAADSLENYTHLRQAIAHPMGSGFREAVVILNYRYRRFMADLQVNYASLESRRNPGLDLIYTLAGNDDLALYSARDYLFFKPSVAFIVNPASNMQIKTGLLIRKMEGSVPATGTSLIFVAFTTQVNNLFFDI